MRSHFIPGVDPESRLAVNSCKSGQSYLTQRHRENNNISPHLTFPVKERDFSEISSLSLRDEDKSQLLFPSRRLNGSGEVRVGINAFGSAGL